MRRKFARCFGVASDKRQDQANGTLMTRPCEMGDDLILGDAQIVNARLHASHSVHAMPPESLSDAR
jgi:hypothetical protein